MSHVVILGGTKGIGRDAIPTLTQFGHVCTPLGRAAFRKCCVPVALNELDMRQPVDALFLCQRYRGLDEWAGEFETSLTTSKQAIEWAGAHQVQSVVVMASVAAVSVEEEQPVSYHAAKAALVEMVKYYAVTLGPMRVNAIIPGLTIKPEARGFYDAHPELEQLYTDITPVGRMGTVADIAHLVDFLIGDRSSYLTGQAIALDGGIGLRSQWALARRVTPSLRNLQVTQRKVSHG